MPSPDLPGWMRLGACHYVRDFGARRVHIMVLDGDWGYIVRGALGVTHAGWVGPSAFNYDWTPEDAAFRAMEAGIAWETAGRDLLVASLATPVPAEATVDYPAEAGAAIDRAIGADEAGLAAMIL